MSTIGARIKQCRVSMGMSADALADALGKNRATIYRYESDDIENMPLSIIVPLAKALHVSPSYLMGWDDGADAQSNYFRSSVKREIEESTDIDAAIEAGVDVPFLNKIAYNSGSLSLDDACRAADELGLTVSELLNEKDLRVFSTMDPQVKEIMEKLLDLSEEKREKALDYIRYLSTSPSI